MLGGRRRNVLAFAVLSELVLLLLSVSASVNTLNVTFVDLQRTYIPHYLRKDSLELQIKFARAVDCVIYWPNATNVTNATNATSSGPLPWSIVAWEDPMLEVNTPRALAASGMLVVSTELRYKGTEDDYVKDILLVVAEVLAEAAWQSSPIAGLVGDDLVIYGYQEAAEAALWTVKRSAQFPTYMANINSFNSNLKFRGLALAVPRYSAEGALSSVIDMDTDTAVMFFAGSTDCRFPVTDHAMALYGRVRDGVCKGLAIVNGGTTCYLATAKTIPLPAPPGTESCIDNEQACGAVPAFTEAGQQRLVDPVVIAWIQHQLFETNYSHTLAARTQRNQTNVTHPTYWEQTIRHLNSSSFDYYMQCDRAGVKYTGNRD